MSFQGCDSLPSGNAAKAEKHRVSLRALVADRMSVSAFAGMTEVRGNDRFSSCDPIPDHIITAARAALAFAGGAISASVTRHCHPRRCTLQNGMLWVYIAAQHVLRGISVF